MWWGFSINDFIMLDKLFQASYWCLSGKLFEGTVEYRIIETERKFPFLKDSFFTMVSKWVF